MILIRFFFEFHVYLFRPTQVKNSDSVTGCHLEQDCSSERNSFRVKEMGEIIVSQIKALLNNASMKEVTDKVVKQWLNSLQHLAYDIDDILDDMETEAMHHELSDEPQPITSKAAR